MDFDEQELELATQVGLVAVRWGHIEANSHQLVWHLWDWEEQPGRTITAGMTANRLWDLAESGMEMKPHRLEVLTQFKEWRETAEPLLLDRNKAVHSQWVYDVPGFLVNASDRTSRRARKAGGHQRPFEDWKVELPRIADQVQSCGSAQLQIFFDVVIADQQFEESMADHSTGG